MTKSTLLPASADALARLYTAEATGILVRVMRGEFPGAKPADVMRAAHTLLERGHGKAVQAVISVPARAAVARRLVALDEDALLAIAQGGVRGPERGPQGGGSGGGSHQDVDFVDEGNASASGQSGSASGQSGSASGQSGSASGGVKGHKPVDNGDAPELTEDEIRAAVEGLPGEGGVGVKKGTQIVPVPKSRWDSVAEEAEFEENYDPLA